MTLLRNLLILSLVLGSPSCGKKESAATADAIIYGTVTLENGTTASDNGALSLTKATCTINADTSTASIVLTGATTLSSLSINIKSLLSTAETYTCTQATDNATSLDSLGLKFDSCSVEIARPITSSSNFNGYAMYRSSTKVALFTYGGSCTVSVTSASSTNVVGSFLCTQLVQTYYNSSPVNPITDHTPLIDAKGSFKCQ